MRVVGLPEFLRCRDEAIKTKQDETDFVEFLGSLAVDHESAHMRASLIRIDGTQVQLWATRPIFLSSGEYRITWRYEERDEEEAVVCYTLAEF